MRCDEDINVQINNNSPSSSKKLFKYKLQNFKNRKYKVSQDSISQKDSRNNSILVQKKNTQNINTEILLDSNNIDNSILNPSDSKK